MVISDDEILHSLTNAVDLMDDKEYRGAKKLVVKLRNKVQKKVEENNRLKNKELEKLRASVEKSNE